MISQQIGVAENGEVRRLRAPVLTTRRTRSASTKRSRDTNTNNTHCQFTWGESFGLPPCWLGSPSFSARVLASAESQSTN